MMRRYVTQTRPARPGTILRVVLIQQLTRGACPAPSAPAVAAPASPAARSRRYGLRRRPPTVARALRWQRHSRRCTAHRTITASIRQHRTTAVATTTGAGRGRVGVAYPTGGPVRPYTKDELAAGVDLYTRAMKARAGASSQKANP